MNEEFAINFRLSLSALLFGSSLVACGGGGGGGGGSTVSTPVAPPVSSASCDVAAQQEFVLAVAEDWYLWYDEMADVSPSDYDTAEAYLAALTAPLAADSRDPGFSYLTTQAEDEANFTSGAFVGFGFRFAIDDEGRYLISDAFEGGPAFEAGFVRGAELVAVDTGSGFTTMREFEEQGTGLDVIFGGNVDGLERSFRLRIDGELIDVTAAKTEVDVPPLAAAPRTIAREGHSPAGYIHLRSFTLTANAELESAFEELREAGVTDFIIDLRYNGGGLVDVAERFIDLLGGEIADGETGYRLSHNAKRAAENFDYTIGARTNSVSPLRIAFITSEATASASELLINSLSPFVEVALIGSDTSGKAVGQYAFDQTGCDTRLRLVSFETVNGEGFGGFYTGLVDTGRFTLCANEDTFTGAFGAPEEQLTSGALAWLGEGVCPSAVAPTTLSSRALRRGPPPIAAEHRADRRSDWVQ